MKAVCERNGKRVHRQADAKEDAVEDKEEIERHMQASHKKIRYGETVPDLFGHVMYSFAVVHESRILKQARPESQYVDLLRCALATPPWNRVHCMNRFPVCQHKHSEEPPTRNA